MEILRYVDDKINFALAEKLAQAEVLHVALDGATRQMRRAAAFLEQQRTDGRTQAAQESARARLAQLMAALEEQTKNEDKPVTWQGLDYVLLAGGSTKMPAGTDMLERIAETGARILGVVLNNVNLQTHDYYYYQRYYHQSYYNSEPEVEKASAAKHA